MKKTLSLFAALALASVSYASSPIENTVPTTSEETIISETAEYKWIRCSATVNGITYTATGGGLFDGADRAANECIANLQEAIESQQ